MSRATSGEPAARVAGAPRWLIGTLRAIGSGLVAQPRIVRIALVIAWACWIWFLSSQKMPTVRHVPFAGVLGNLAHGPVFGLLGLLVIAALAPRPEPLEGGGAWPRIEPRTLLLGVGLVLAYGFADELHQAFTPGRHPAFGDLLTDVAGAAAVALTIRRIDPRGADGQGLLSLWGVALLVLLITSTFADEIGFFGITGTPGESR